MPTRFTLCQRLDLLPDAFVAIESRKFNAVNSRERNLTSAKLNRQTEDIESSINRYLAALETAPRQNRMTRKILSPTST